jgi:phenylalanyl-tRNA synthetase beta chain
MFENLLNYLRVLYRNKEIVALTTQTEIKSKYVNKYSKYENIIQDVGNSSQQLVDCSTFLALTVENLTDFSIPNWVTEKLLCSGIEPANNLTDFQTYILLETGYPSEFYDLDKIRNITKSSEFEISLKPALDNQKFIANNGSEYLMNPEILLLEAGNCPLSIGGIISNNQVCYTDDTTSLLIEMSIFNSKKIRQQSRLLGLRTDRSARYEKGLNNSYFVIALIRLILLLKISNPQLICKIHTAYQTEQPKLPNIALSYDNTIEILGPVRAEKSEKSVNLTPLQITEYLTRLNFVFTFDENNLIWFVEIPLSRIDDIEREIDLIEEVGRLHGFNNFVTNLPNIYNIGTEDFSYQIRKKLTSCFVNEGFNELIQYSLVDDKTSNHIKLVNPLIADCSTLRKSLLPNLINIRTENSKQGNKILEGFEYGHVFSGDITTKYVEKEVVSGIFGGLKSKREWDESSKSLSWFEAKGKMEDLFKKLNLSVNWKNSNLEFYKDILHPYRTAELYIDEHKFLGVFGQIHPVSSKKNNISKDIFLFEFDLETLKQEFIKQKLPLYQSYSSYPKISKDLSFVIDKTVSFNKIESTILKTGTEYLKNIELLDEYQGDSIPDHQTSLCVQLIFQSKEKTLTTKEVDKILKDIETVLTKEYSVVTRI